MKRWERGTAGLELALRDILKEQTVVTQASSSYGSAMWSVKKTNEEWWLMMNEVTLASAATVPDVLHMQYELEAK